MYFIFFRLDNLTEELGSMRKQVEELYLFRYILIKKFLFVNFVMFYAFQELTMTIAKVEVGMT